MAFSGFLADRQGGRWIRESLPDGYVAVAENFGHHSGFHVHVAIRGPLPLASLLRLKRSWTAYLEHRCGIAPPVTSSGLWRVNVAAPKPWHSSTTLGTYLGKHLDTCSGPGRRYRRGQGMARPVHEVVWAYLTTAAAWALASVFGRPRKITHPVTGYTLGWTAESEPRRLRDAMPWKAEV